MKLFRSEWVGCKQLGYSKGKVLVSGIRVSVIIYDYFGNVVSDKEYLRIPHRYTWTNERKYLI